MPNSKISALPSATTPLAGTETLPVVQGGITEQVSVANLTAGRTVSMSGATVTGLTASKPVFTDASDNLVSTGTVPTDQGGTGLTSFTANGVVYASSTTALATSSGLTYNGTTFATTGNATFGDATTDTVTVNGYMGVGGAPNPAYGIRVLSTALTGAQQIGYDARVVGTTSATSSVRGYVAVPGTADAVFTCSETIGFLAASPARGAASTITTSHGVYISDQNQATNNYGITSLVSSGSNKWNIYASGTAANYLAGTLLIGTTASQALSNGNVIGNLQIETANGSASATMVRNTANTVGPIFAFGKSRGAALGARTAVNSGDTLGEIRFDGADGTSMLDAAYIFAQADAAFTTGSAPGRLIFSTTAPGGTTPTERMRIDSAGYVGIGTTSPAARLHLAGDITAASWTTNGIGIRYAAATYTDSSTAASGTVASAGIHALARPTIAASNATVTYTNAATLYIANSPANGSNVTVTNPWSIWVDDGNVRFDGNEVVAGLVATAAAAPTIASAATIAPTTRIAFVSGTTTISTITAPTPISAGGGQITLIPTGLWATNTAGNIALATTAVVNRALTLTYDSGTAKWYPSY